VNCWTLEEQRHLIDLELNDQLGAFLGVVSLDRLPSRNRGSSHFRRFGEDIQEPIGGFLVNDADVWNQYQEVLE
jgi:hypothetical protein